MSSALERKYEEQLRIAKQFIEENNEFAVVSHISPDGDAIGSTLAVGWLLSQLGKSFVMINEGPTPRKFNYLWQSDSIVNFSADSPKTKFKHIIAVDCADFLRIGKVSENFMETSAIPNIDHHPTNDSFGMENLINPDAAATVEIIYDLARMFDIAWNLDFAACIYTGLLTDTGGFRYSNTTPKVLSNASEMLNYGVNGHVLAEHLLEKMSYPQMRLLQKSLANLALTPDRKIGWISVSMEDLADSGASHEDSEGLVNYPRNIVGVEVGILFKELAKNEIKVSIRSTGTVDVSIIAKSLGGGGHRRAAGCTLLCSMSEAIDRMIREVGSVLT